MGACGSVAHPEEKSVRPLHLLLGPGGYDTGMIERRPGRLDGIAAVLHELPRISRSTAAVGVNGKVMVGSRRSGGRFR